jgi:hypothetical protein
MVMQLKHLLEAAGISAESVLAIRHKPEETQFAQSFPLLALEQPDLFNMYQSTQKVPMERRFSRLIGNGYIASFIGKDVGFAVFSGLYRVAGARQISEAAYLEMPEVIKLQEFGHLANTGGRTSIQLFELIREEIYAHWIGKLVVGWPTKGLTWWRHPQFDNLPITSILDENMFSRRAQRWDQISLSWAELKSMPERWKNILSQWPAVYYIIDKSDRMGYVGSAYGSENLFGRWSEYGQNGHGGNALTKCRDPENFQFSILELLPPNLNSKQINAIESNWKIRLRSRHPNGLNKN